MNKLQDILPKASLFDPEDSSEGSLDPLGLSGLANALASRLASEGLRERQQNIRFLTLCCVGWSLITAIDPDLKPGDRNSNLEQAFEWIVLECLVGSAIAGAEPDPRIPGVLKAKDCLSRGLPMNADRYLRTPGTFGFFGVYRSLARYLRIVAEARDGRPILLANGERLFEAWKSDNGLPGFIEDGIGSGRDAFLSFSHSLSDTWTAGSAKIRREIKAFIYEYLSPSVRPGRNERDALWSILKDEGVQTTDDNRRFLIKGLLDPEVQAIFSDDQPGTERRFHDLLRGSAFGNMASVLDAIRDFEAFASCLMESFDALRSRLSGESRLVELAPLASSDPIIREAAASAPAAFAAAEAALVELGLSSRFVSQFAEFALSMDPARFIETLVGHHQRTQKQKPPAGKSSWFETDRGKIGIRPLYRPREERRDPRDYLFAYRGWTLYRFVSAVGSRES